MRTVIDRLRSKLNRPFARGAACTLAASVVAVVALPAAAMADNYYKTCGDSRVSCETGVTAGLVEGECKTTSAALASTSVCVDYSGDNVYVRDGKADGYAAMAYVWSAEGVELRYCRNNQGYGTWVKCHFNWVEATDHTVGGGWKVSSTALELEQLWTWSGK